MGESPDGGAAQDSKIQILDLQCGTPPVKVIALQDLQRGKGIVAKLLLVADIKAVADEGKGNVTLEIAVDGLGRLFGLLAAR